MFPELCVSPNVTYQFPDSDLKKLFFFPISFLNPFTANFTANMTLDKMICQSPWSHIGLGMLVVPVNGSNIIFYVPLL